jgi:hypothetical protein
MVVYAEPPVFPSWEKMTGRRARQVANAKDSDTMRLLGFFTHSHSYSHEDTMRKGFFGDTHDPDAGMFACLAVFDVLDENNRHIDYECNTLSVPFGCVDTMKNLVDDLSERFYFDAGATAAEMPDGAVRWMRQVMNTVFGTLFYLCSTTLEAEKVPTRATQQFSKTIARKPLSLYRVGWTTGAALTRYRQSRSRTPSEQSGELHQQQDPQHRRAHLKVVWTGKGRTVPKLTLVSPYWTHTEKLGVQGVNTVHSVPEDYEEPPKESIRTALSLRP